MKKKLLTNHEKINNLEENVSSLSKTVSARLDDIEDALGALGASIINVQMQINTLRREVKVDEEKFTNQ